MAKKRSKKKEVQKSGVYQHQNQTTQRPSVGVQEGFPDWRVPGKYRYDSSLAPELSWDENGERDFAEWLLSLIRKASKDGEVAVFRTGQIWKGTGERFGSLAECVARLSSLTLPFLNWSGKAERQQFAVPTIPLFVHERHSTQAILHTLSDYKAVGTTVDLFGDPQLDVADELNAYEHKGPWSNRLVLGDSLQVMNSLLEYEGMGGQVQMVYIDPPYGVKFGSNFQPFVRKRDVTHGSDEQMIREPETVKAYRDTWELGLHSYLTYLRDRLLLARELLTESGSVFVQISDENLQFVRNTVDEVFGSENYVVTIPIKKKGSQKGGLLDPVNDYLVWAAKDKDHLRGKYHQLFVPAPLDAESVGTFRYIELPDGREITFTQLEKELRKPNRYYRDNPDLLFTDFPGARVFTSENATGGKPGKSQAVKYTFRGKAYDPGIGRGLGWKATAISEDGKPCGMDRLADANRLFVGRNQLRFKRYHDDFGYKAISNWWDNLGGASNPIYVVQTNDQIVERCILMTTDPGDLVIDVTCGSGTTAFVAEKWGRRWISCDTSRVPIALARQRLLTAEYQWYELNDPTLGPAGGFVYKRRQDSKKKEVGGLVPHITPGTIANDEDPVTETLVYKPESAKGITRVCGPFTVEATIQAAQSVASEAQPVDEAAPSYENSRRYLDRMIEVLRQSQTLRLPGNKSLEFDNVRTLSATDHEFLHAEAIESNGSSTRVAVVFGPEDGAINSEIVFEAAREAYYLKFDSLYFFGFAIQAKARELVDDRKKLRLPCFYINVAPDVVMSDLLKTSRSSEIFSVTGLPDVSVGKTGRKSASGDILYQAKMLGLDIFRPHDLETESIAGENLPCWMLDTNYNGMVFMARQVFFPKTSAWDNLQKSLKGRFSDSVWEHLAGTASEPFVTGEHRCIAVKVIDERGNELLVVKEVQGAK